MMTPEGSPAVSVTTPQGIGRPEDPTVELANRLRRIEDLVHLLIKVIPEDRKLPKMPHPHHSNQLPRLNPKDLLVIPSL
jgi:hypothetical protein